MIENIDVMRGYNGILWVKRGLRHYLNIKDKEINSVEAIPREKIILLHPHLPHEKILPMLDNLRAIIQMEIENKRRIRPPPLVR